MANQQRFEGSTLAEVLAKVQKEIGPDAKIVSAQKARSGGFFGFFQRERFIVTVDLEATSATHAPTNPEPETPASLLDLAEKISSQETSSTASKGASEEIPASFKDSTPAASTQPSPQAKAAKADIVDHQREQRPISTETDSFAEVLSRVAYQADMTTEPTPAPLEPQKSTAMSDLQPETVERKPVVEDRPAFLDVAAPSAPTPASVVPPFRTRISDHPLATLGLPASYIPAAVETTQLQKALTVSLERLPQPPNIKPSKGCVIAVVGEIVEALELAEELAHKWRRPVEEVVLASQYYRGRGSATVIRNVTSADDSRRSWSRRPRPTIVAIDAYPGSRDTAWAEHILTALEPIATYGVADATRKAEDIATWASQLGGIDCLAVNHLEETVSPASVLATGIPVERIDGRVATPAYWAMLLTERLSAA